MRKSFLNLVTKILFTIQFCEITIIMQKEHKMYTIISSYHSSMKECLGALREICRKKSSCENIGQISLHFDLL